MTYISNMSYITAAPNAASRPIFPPLGWIKAWILTAHRRRKDRHDYAYLLQLEPHMLKDIGITSSDVQAAFRKAYEG